MILLDTHAWIWWISDPDRLPLQTRQAIDLAAGRHELFVSTISAWEVAMLVRKGRLSLTLDVRDWVARCEALPFLTFVPPSAAIAVEATRLPEFAHSDPAGRIIIATALSLGARLVTKDEKIAAWPHVETLW